ncbi:MAG: hypothetical protein U0487_01145 [Patescibacteria group bacterium]
MGLPDSLKNKTPGSAPAMDTLFGNGGFILPDHPSSSESVDDTVQPVNEDELEVIDDTVDGDEADDEDEEEEDDEEEEEMVVDSPPPLMPTPVIAPAIPLATSPGFAIPTVTPPQPPQIELPKLELPLPPSPSPEEKTMEKIDYRKLASEVDMQALAILTANEIMSDGKHVQAITEITARHLGKDRRISAQTEPPSKPAAAPVATAKVVETKAPEPERHYYPAGKEPKERSDNGNAENSTEPKKDRGGMYFMITVAFLVLALIGGFVWAGRYLYDRYLSDDHSSPATAPSRPDGSHRATPVARANNVDASTVSSCQSQLDLAQAPLSMEERKRLNCGVDVVCGVDPDHPDAGTLSGIDFANRRITVNGQTYYDMRPRPDADLEAERRGCTVYHQPSN